MLLTGFTGCANTEETSQQTQEETGNGVDNQAAPEETGNETDKQTDTASISEQNKQNQSDSANEADAQSAQSTPQKYNPSEGTEHLGGKVQSVADDGMIVAQTTVMGEGEDAGMVTIVDEKDAKKIPVKFTADTRVEHWVIQGGGAGIDMRDAALSDLKSGLGVEVEGDYEGENFIATRILIEEYK